MSLLELVQYREYWAERLARATTPEEQRIARREWAILNLEVRRWNKVLGTPNPLSDQ